MNIVNSGYETKEIMILDNLNRREFTISDI